MPSEELLQPEPLFETTFLIRDSDGVSGRDLRTTHSRSMKEQKSNVSMVLLRKVHKNKDDYYGSFSDCKIRTIHVFNV